MTGPGTRVGLPEAGFTGGTGGGIRDPAGCVLSGHRGGGSFRDLSMALGLPLRKVRRDSGNQRDDRRPEPGGEMIPRFAANIVETLLWDLWPG